MAGTITALEYQKRNRDRVSVFLDGRFAFGLPAIVAAGLRKGQVLSDAEIEALQEGGTIESGYHKALDFLSYRPRSRAEVETYLQKRGFPEAQAEAIIERLEGAGLLDDAAFAQFWVENRERFRPRGPRALRHELWSKGISDDIIEQALALVDVSDGAYRSASKKARRMRQLDRQTFVRKIVEYLARRGFDYEVAREAAERHWSELKADR
ncbi:MAG: RecX family transcriptional regulator [Anaerolineae bacterium]|jgi:regulatory protein